MKKIFNFIQSIWNKFLNLFKRNMTPLEIELKKTINDYLNLNNNVFIFLTIPSANISTKFSRIDNNHFKACVIFSISNLELETQLDFTNLKGKYILDITDGKSSFINSDSTNRNKLCKEVDFLNNRLEEDYRSLFIKYHQ